MINHHEGENILEHLRKMEARLGPKIDLIAKGQKELEVSVGMLFKSEREQEQKLWEFEKRIQQNASISAGKIGGAAGTRNGALVAGLASILVAVISKLLEL